MKPRFRALVRTGPIIWDAPVRLVHWLSVLCFAGAWLSAESDRLRPLHLAFGLTLLGLMAFRLVWGLVGSRTARFTQFVRGPHAVLRHLRGMVSGKVEDPLGHNPAGGWAVLALVALSLLSALSGWATWQLGERYENLHEGLASALLVLVLLHVAAVLLTSLRVRRNLVAAMLSGRRAGSMRSLGMRAHRGLALLLGAAVLGFWAWAFGAGAEWMRAGDATHESHRSDREHEDEAPAHGASLIAGKDNPSPSRQHRRHDDDD